MFTFTRKPAPVPEMPMPRLAIRYLACLLTLLASLHAAADPAALRSWDDWVLEKHPDHTCPWVVAKNSERVCIWPGQLALDLRADGMSFNYQVEVFRDDALVPLPGGAGNWPLRVTVNGSRAAVLDRAGTPHALLSRGKHEIGGQFRWQRRPASLPLPESIALLKVTEAGQPANTERRGAQLILGRDSAVAPVKQSNSLQVEVFRKLADGVPMTLETRVVMTVSGEPREVQLGQLAWPNTALMGIDSPLPARIEDNGDLRIQLSAGRHTLIAQARFLQVVEQLTTNRHDDDWPAVEYLSFAADSNLRQVTLSGAPGIDTSQAPVPEEWKALPTWRLGADTTMQINTEYRGDQSPGNNTLSVTRNLWLDFDGDALTGVESITGAMRSEWRLNTQADTRLGSAQVSGHPVLVTQHAGGEGVEIRSPDIALKAVTRVASPTQFSATGWKSRADTFNATLHIPPGWRVLHAAGVEDIRGTWLSDWDLWDIFLLLVLVAATRKLLGFKAAALAIAALLTAYHEPGMPTALLATLLLLLPLAAIARGRIRRGVAVATTLTCIAAVLALVAFSIGNFRLAIYPSLERSSVGVYDYASQFDHNARSVASDASLESTAAMAPRAAVEGKMLAAAAPPRIQQNAYLLGETDRVQTGPGAPNWLWNSVTLQSASPVPQAASLSVMYSPPWLTRLWRVLGVLLTLAYAGVLMSALVRTLRNPPAATAPTASGAMAAPAASAVTLALTAGLVLSGLPQPAAAQAFPSPQLLNQLEQRLLQPPACAPHCIALDEGLITTTRQTLSIGFSAYAAADVLLQLPTPREGWQVSSLQVDGAEATARLHEGYLSVRLTRGPHVVSLSGALEGDIASVSLPLAIHNLNTSTTDWQLSGLVDGRVPSGTLSLRALSAARQEAGNRIKPDPIAPFFVVHREFDIGLQWRVVTRVTRLAPTSGPVAVEVPLLAAERPLSDAVNFSNGRARLQFSDRQREIRWESSISPLSQLQLQAAAGEHYVETWRVRPSALWRVSHEGLPPTRPFGGADSLQPLWKPWPGESLTLHFSRPEGSAGPTFTTEAVNLSFQHGAALRQSQLSLNVKASMGQDYNFTLPTGSRVTALSHNGNELSLPEGNTISVSLQPGDQLIGVTFEEDGGSGWLSESPRVELPDGASNISLAYTLPQDRWPLYLSGPPIGPAMLYWGVFCVIVLGALLLNWLNKRLATGIPIGLPGWLLLGVGLSTVNSYGVLVVAGFLFLLAFRQRIDSAAMSRLKFNLMQIALGIGAFIALATLVSAIPLGLLSSPDMLVTGNNSWSHLYHFFQDRAAADQFPTATVVSVSLMVYRAVMLAWALWLANKLLRWVAWGWQAYSKNGVWAAKAKT
ncbi:MAG: hypothetical protein ACJAQ8_000128 [Haliea salexigens]|jgi:hypothetical protein|tara:strand:- start:4303 stop:8388 length:4086 start_codon:yes stop_codon:yes gene_type:complete